MNSTRKFSPTKNYITPLTSVLQNDKDSVMTFCNDLKTRGYAFVKLPNDVVKKVDIATKIIEDFYTKDKSYKNMFKKEPIFGYFDVSHKESFRFLTGTRLDEQKLPFRQLSLSELCICYI